LGRLSESAIYSTDGSVRTETAQCTFEASSPVCGKWEILLSKTNLDASPIRFYFDVTVNLVTIVTMAIQTVKTIMSSHFTRSAMSHNPAPLDQPVHETLIYGFVMISVRRSQLRSHTGIQTSHVGLNANHTALVSVLSGGANFKVKAKNGKTAAELALHICAPAVKAVFTEWINRKSNK
jgi:hypothetical protein